MQGIRGICAYWQLDKLPGHGKDATAARLTDGETEACGHSEVAQPGSKPPPCLSRPCRKASPSKITLAEPASPEIRGRPRQGWWGGSKPIRWQHGGAAGALVSGS